jgi:hypothetical protein
MASAVTTPAPAAAAPTGARPHGRPVRALIAACVLLALLSLLLPSSPTYDPWAWINWGREILHVDLNTQQGPSWKPLPVAFTTVFAIFGGAAPALWLVAARAGALLAVAMAYRLASRFAGRVAGVAAAVGVVLGETFVRNAAIGNSEGLLVAFTLWAVERHLDGRRDHALALGFCAALLRPEVWPFLGAYAVWLWIAEPGLRKLIAGLVALIPVLWFLPEVWGSGEPLRASSRAKEVIKGSLALADRPALEVAKQGVELVPAPLLAGFVAGTGLAVAGLVRRRPRANDAVVAALAGAVVAWVALVAVMTQAGYAGNPRYLVAAAGLACVVGGVGLARLGGIAAALIERGRPSAHKAARAVAVALPLGALLFAIPSFENSRDSLPQIRYEAQLDGQLDAAIHRAGGRDRVLACGHPYTGPLQVSVLAWHLRVHGDQVGLAPQAPGVIFRTRAAGSPKITPDVPRVGPRFATVARAGKWRVLAACGPPRTGG